MAGGKGFEPSDPCESTLFKSVTLNQLCHPPKCIISYLLKIKNINFYSYNLIKSFPYLFITYSKTSFKSSCINNLIECLKLLIFASTCGVR